MFSSNNIKDIVCLYGLLQMAHIAIKLILFLSFWFIRALYNYYFLLPRINEDKEDLCIS